MCSDNSKRAQQDFNLWSPCICWDNLRCNQGRPTPHTQVSSIASFCLSFCFRCICRLSEVEVGLAFLLSWHRIRHILASLTWSDQCPHHRKSSPTKDSFLHRQYRDTLLCQRTLDWHQSGKPPLLGNPFSPIQTVSDWCPHLCSCKEPTTDW